MRNLGGTGSQNLLVIDPAGEKKGKRKGKGGIPCVGRPSFETVEKGLGNKQKRRDKHIPNRA